MEQTLILGRYRPLEQLGEGGHGSVVVAYDTKMARRVAVKRLPLPSRRAQGQTATIAGLAEARTAAMLNHPHIVTVHEWDTDSDEAFLIMEYVEGASLADLLEETGRPLDRDAAAALAQDVGSALRFAHDNGVLHLDMKPENVLISREGVIKVADFGVAELTGIGGSARGSGGTLGFMPPEQLRGGVLDERTDEWAFAATIYEALTGATPLAADTLEGALFKAEIAPLPGPSEFDDHLPEVLDDVLLTGLAPDPDDRFEDVSELVARLVPWLGVREDGIASLADDVASLLAEDELDAEERPATPGAWDLLARYAPAVRRALAAALGGWLAFGGLSALPLPDGAVWAASALIALAGALAPGLGLALGLAALAVGLAAAAGWLALVALALPAAGWWLLLGRDGRGHAILTLSSPALAAAALGPAAPLLAGFANRPLLAAASSAASAVAVQAASAASGGAAPLLTVPASIVSDPVGTLTQRPLDALIASPGPLIAVVAWALAGAVASVLSARATRTGAWAGAFAGTVVLGGGYALWASLPGGFVWPSTVVLKSLTASLIMVVLVGAAGAPPRPEEEGATDVRDRRPTR